MSDESQYPEFGDHEPDDAVDASDDEETSEEPDEDE